MSKVATMYLPWAGGLCVLSIGFIAKAAMESRPTQTQPLDLTSHDAKLGSFVGLPPKDLFGHPIRSGCKTLLVFAGSCSQCSLKSVPAEKLRHAPEEQVVMVYLSSEKQLLETFTAPDPRVLLVSDPKGAIVGRLGAVSAPRFYLMEGSRISNIWKDTLTWPTAWAGGAP
jgi:hypothetical protein